MPLSGVEKFVGREEELQKLHQLLQDNKQVAIAAIAGMGGVGKTELALQYAIQHRETYNGGLCWLLPKTGDVGIQVVQFVRTQLDLKPPEDFDILAQVQYCWRRWREGDVLLVLDDVSDYEQVKPYLQSLPSRFKVLMTTRQKLGRIAQLSLDVLQPEAALELLKSLLKETPERIEKELALANQLCEWLGYLPLGVELVGRYLARKQDLSLAEMLRRLENKRLDERSLSKSKSEADMTAQRGVLAAFELSWQELEDSDKQLGCLLSLFAAAPIPWKLVEQCLPEEDAKDLEDIRDDKLLNLHLLQRKGEGIYQLHPLLREFFQYKLTGLEQAEELKRSLCRVMVAVAQDIPQSSILKQITAVSSAIPHIAEVAKNLIQYVSDDDLPWSFIGNARFYDAQGLYNQALPWYEQCLEVTKKRLGEEHPDVALSLNNLAALYDSQGRYSEAEPLYIQALALTRKLLGEERPSVALSLNNLAALYDSQGRYSEAEPLFIQALALRRKLLGEEHPDVALSLNNLAALYRSQGRYSEAEPLYIQALALRRKLLGEEHPDVAASLNNLAALYYFQGRYSEAEPLYIQALALYRKLLGEEHPDVAASLNNLAFLYYSQGRYSEAEPLYIQALALRRKLLGEEHPDVAASLNNLAALYDSQGRYSEAEPLYIQALVLTRKLLGEEHPDVALSLNNLAALYDSQGRYSEAEPLYIQALALTRKLLGEEHPSVALSLNNLAALYDSQGRYSEAEPLFIQALALRRKLLGEEHPSVALSLNNLAFVYDSQDRYSEAEPLYIQALDIFEQRLGANHPNTVTVRENLAYLRDRLPPNPE
ncbi:tetratricopeptide repeat protein [Nostoc sp. ATCC 53789]|uniref:tetratricopeptide repeat protein n=1 Tax=Nostoc sp. ATCC 53789 TaxID=76335 RepID=UPI00132E78B2|nr:tetratricopeptide repeat protein [Nostoc sp. ATCC 53789]QHG18398.1 tetratricopeptide repeat protein [Nostoc sp. ATCC 53789]